MAPKEGDRAAEIVKLVPSLAMVRTEIGPEWDDEQAVLAVSSPAWRSLLSMGHREPDLDALCSLSELWRAAGSPTELDPAKLYPPGDVVSPILDMVVGNVEHHEGGEVAADWDTAAWYVHQLDPGVIRPHHVLDLTG